MIYSRRRMLGDPLSDFFFGSDFFWSSPENAQITVVGFYATLALGALLLLRGLR